MSHKNRARSTRVAASLGLIALSAIALAGCTRYVLEPDQTTNINAAVTPVPPENDLNNSQQNNSASSKNTANETNNAAPNKTNKTDNTPNVDTGNASTPYVPEVPFPIQ